MAEAIGVASGIAQLVAVAVQITQLSYSYVSDVINAPRSQKAYLQEVSALTDVLFRLEQALQDSEAAGVVDARPGSLSDKVISECHKELTFQRSKLERHTNRLFWPFQDRELKKAVDDLHRFRGMFSDYIVAAISVTSSATFRSIDTLKQSQDKYQLLEWLQRPYDSRIPPDALPGTGSWLLSHPQFQDWCTESPSILWCYGPPGVGKSMLASIAIDQLTRLRRTDYACITYYFSDFIARKQQTELAILQSILRQMVEYGDDETVSALLKHRNELGTTPKPADLSLAFAEACHKRKTYLILDAPDELETKQVVSRLESFVDAGCRVLVTSRDHPDLREAFSAARQIEAHASSEDLTVYVQHRFGESDFHDTMGNTHTIVDAVVNKADGLFLLAKLLMDQLLGLPTIKQMRRSLETLPAKLSEAFESSVARIDTQSEALREMAYRLISWIVHAERPLQPAEIIHAFAIEPGDDEVDEENLTTIQTLLRICVGLVVLNRDRNTLGMVHISAYEFFHVREMNNTREDLARTSLTYVCVRPLRAGPCSNIDAMKRRLRELPFLEYAARNWGKHASDPSLEEKLSDLINRLLEDPHLLSSSSQALHYRNEIKDSRLASAALETLPKGQGQLHIATFWGLQRTTRRLIEAGEDKDSPDSQKWTPLHWAASNGHVAVMNILLEGGASVDSLDSQRWTPLFWTCFKGSIAALQILLDRNANHLLRDIHGWTALHWAVSRGEQNVVSILLKHHSHYMAEGEKQGLWSTHWSKTLNDIEIDVSMLNSRTPMEVAAELRDASLFDTLLKNQHETGEKSFNASWSSGHFDPPMSNVWRIMNKAERINGLESYVTSNGWSSFRGRPSDTVWKARLLHSAIKDHKLLIVQLLIEIGADVNYTHTRSALHAAAFKKDPEFTEVLLEHGADVSLRDCHGQTALHQAVLNGFEKTIAALLRGGSDVNARRPRKNHSYGSGDNGADDQTPLMLVCGYNIQTMDDRKAQTRIINLLISYGADTSLQDNRARTCLHYAAMSANIDVVRKIIDLGVDVNIRDKEGITVLHHAARSCNIDLVELVIDNGAHISSIDSYGRSAIHHLAEADDENEFELKDLKCIFNLLYSGADPSMLNGEYDSPRASGKWYTSTSLARHTAISIAIAKKNWKLFLILKESNAALPEEFSPLLDTAIKALNPTAVHFLIKHGAELSREGSSLRELHYAIRHPSSSVNVDDLDQVLEDLISIGLDVNQHAGWPSDSLLNAAAIHTNSKQVARVLLGYGANPYDIAGGLDSFLLATIHGNLDFLHSLLGNTSTPAPEGHWAQKLNLSSDVESEDLERVCVALEESGQLESLGKEGHTILSVAAKEGNHHFVERLLAHGANTEASDSHGWGPLHRAVLYEHKTIVESLLKAGADVNAPTVTWPISNVPRPSGLYLGNKWTGRALHLAAMMGNAEIAAILLENGADVRASTGTGTGISQYPDPLHGPSALHIALGTGMSYGIPVPILGARRLSIARMLIEKGASANSVADHLTLHHLHNFKGYGDVLTSIRPTPVPASENEPV